MSDNSYPRVKRWRENHPEKYKKIRKDYYDKTVPKHIEDYANTRRRWTEGEIELLTTFDGTDAELAKKISRSVRAIQHKRAMVARQNEHVELTKAKGAKPRYKTKTKRKKRTLGVRKKRTLKR